MRIFGEVVLAARTLHSTLAPNRKCLRGTPSSAGRPRGCMPPRRRRTRLAETTTRDGQGGGFVGPGGKRDKKTLGKGKFVAAGLVFCECRGSIRVNRLCPVQLEGVRMRTAGCQGHALTPVNGGFSDDERI